MVRIVDGGARNAIRIVIGKLEDQHGCLMAFRGSSNIMNWVRDFQGWKLHPEPFSECPGCKVHSGFYTIWNNVRDSALQALQEVGCASTGSADNMLYITGHSL